MGWPTKLRPSPAMVVALIALFVSVGGVGYAATTIGSGQIKNNSVQSKDIKNNSVGSKDIKNRTLGTKDISSKALKSLKGGTGATGPQGPAGAAGSALAYGRVSSNGTVIASESKGITVTKETDGPGRYCVKVAGVSSAAHPIVVSADQFDGTGTDHLAQYSSVATSCRTGGGWRILTENLTGTQANFTDIAFSVVIP